MPQKAGGSSALPSATDPRTEQQTKDTDPRTGTLKNGKVKLFSADRGLHVPAPEGGKSGRHWLVCVSLLCLLVALVGQS